MALASNRQVVQELKAGDPIGCRHLIDQYQSWLTGEATNVFHVPLMDAEEIASDVLLAVVKKIDSFEFKRSDADLHYWVMTIFRNRVRDFMRHQAWTEGLMERFKESVQENEEISSTERAVLGAAIQNYLTALPTSILHFSSRGV